MLYMNKETGEVLSKHEMLEQFRDDYDGGDPTNPLGWGEYFDEIPGSDKQFVTLETFADYTEDDHLNKKVFMVKPEWLLPVLEDIDRRNNREGITIEKFLDEYIYDETEAIYYLAKAKGEIFKEWQE